MITAGLKLTQSGGIALIRDGTLEFNIELPKLDDLHMVPQLLAAQNYDIEDVDEWAIDGWDGATDSRLLLRNNGASLTVKVAPYRETERAPDPGKPGQVGNVELGGKTKSYTSYVHVASHIAAAYCTSPFAQRGEPAMVLVWDSGCFPRLYHVDAGGRIEPGGELFPLIGHAVAGMLRDSVAPGTADDDIKAVLHEVFHKHFEADTPGAREYRQAVTGCGGTAEPSHRYVHGYLDELRERMSRLGADDVDVLASVQEFTTELLIQRIARKMRAWKGDGPFNLCFAGDCSLNIGWNSGLRGHPMIHAMWVPPFPDDSGSAIGTAALHVGREDGLRKLDWSVRLGPELARHSHVPAGWSVSPCQPEELARLLHRTGRPAVVLDGRAKLGPRALGSRSILAPAVDPGMRELLSRPVAPLCLAEYAPEVFDPGTPDPYMHYAHRVRPEWADRIPAIAHSGGTARLQTVGTDDDPTLTAVLREYRKWSGIPVLCGTSAYFPDPVSAMRWGEIDMVWSDAVLHRRVHRSAA